MSSKCQTPIRSAKPSTGLVVRILLDIWASSALAAGLFIFTAGCHSAPAPERNSSPPKIALQQEHTEPIGSSAIEDCGLTDYPVSRSNREMLADVTRDDKKPPDSSMLAKIAIDKDGKITHLRVLRLAHSNSSNWKQIKEAVLADLKKWHYKPTFHQGIPVAVCSDVSVTVDF